MYTLDDFYDVPYSHLKLVDGINPLLRQYPFFYLLFFIYIFITPLIISLFLYFYLHNSFYNIHILNSGGVGAGELSNPLMGPLKVHKTKKVKDERKKDSRSPIIPLPSCQGRLSS